MYVCVCILYSNPTSFYQQIVLVCYVQLFRLDYINNDDLNSIINHYK